MNPRKIYPLEDGEGHKDGEGLLELPSLYYTLPKDCLYLRVILWNIAGPTYLFYFLTINKIPDIFVIKRCPIVIVIREINSVIYYSQRPY